MRTAPWLLGVLVVASSGCGSGSTKPCPTGSARWDGNGHCYEAMLSPGFSWFDAQADCQARGGHLATITSAQENDFVFGLVSGINAFWLLDAFGNGLGPWLGGYQEAGSAEPDGGWRWVTGEPFVYANWEVGQPDNGTPIGQDRLRFFKRSGLVGSRWDDSEAYNPVDHRKGYLCEHE